MIRGFKALLIVVPVTFLVARSGMQECLRKEAGRVSFPSPGTNTSSLILKAGTVAFWTDMNVSYEGNPPLVYQVDLAQAGQTVATAFCDPLQRREIDLGWISLYNSGSHSEHGRGKMRCAAKLPASGPTTIQATLMVDPPGSAVTLTKADLVIKQ